MLSPALASIRRASPRRRALRACLIACALGVASTRVHAQAPSSELTALLAKPVSLATVASLTAHAANPAAQARLAEALRDPRAPVRAVAARVAFVTASRGLVSAARAALETEMDPEAANEMVRVLVTYGGSDAVDAAWAAADRLPTGALPELAASLARAGRPELLTSLPRIVSSRTMTPGLVETVLARLADDPARRQEAIALFSARPITMFALALGFAARQEEPSADLLARIQESTPATHREAVAREIANAKQEAVAPPPRIRMAPAFAPGLWRDLAALHGCKVSQPSAFAANIRYKPEGRPAKVALFGGEPASCMAVTSTLASLSVFPDPRPAPEDYIEMLVVPWHKDIVECSDQPDFWDWSAFFALEDAMGAMTPPKKIKHADPVYPKALQAAGQMGVVTLEGLISETGCMRGLRLKTSSTHILLDASAIVAMAQWRYKPATLDGKPIPVPLTGTIRFSLR